MDVGLVVSVIAMGEPVRAGRFLNVALGAILAAGPRVVEGAGMGAQILGIAAGAAVALLALPRGLIRERFGSWDRFVR